jgi:mono/diheme cytochrome c family protein
MSWSAIHEERDRMRDWIVRASAVLTGVVLAAAIAAAQTPSRAAAAKMKNPVPTSAASVASGKLLYEKQCRMCHGADGKAETPAAKTMKASNLADANWTHGSTDGEIFFAIQEGPAPESKMKGLKGKITDQDTWHLVNYVRSLAAAK